MTPPPYKTYKKTDVFIQEDVPKPDPFISIYLLTLYIQYIINPVKIITYLGTSSGKKASVFL